MVLLVPRNFRSSFSFSAFDSMLLEFIESSKGQIFSKPIYNHLCFLSYLVKREEVSTERFDRRGNNKIYM